MALRAGDNTPIPGDAHSASICGRAIACGAGERGDNAENAAVAEPGRPPGGEDKPGRAGGGKPGMAGLSRCAGTDRHDVGCWRIDTEEC